MRVLNKHSAPVASIAPGAVGEVDERNPGVRIYLDAKHLEPVGPSSPVTTGAAYDKLVAAQREIIERTAQTIAQATQAGQGALADRIRELEDAATSKVAELAAELEAAKARVADLESSAPKKTKKTDPAGE